MAIGLRGRGSADCLELCCLSATVVYQTSTHRNGKSVRKRETLVRKWEVWVRKWEVWVRKWEIFVRKWEIFIRKWDVSQEVGDTNQEVGDIYEECWLLVRKWEAVVRQREAQLSLWLFQRKLSRDTDSHHLRDVYLSEHQRVLKSPSPFCNLEDTFR